MTRPTAAERGVEARATAARLAGPEAGWRDDLVWALSGQQSVPEALATALETKLAFDAALTGSDPGRLLALAERLVRQWEFLTAEEERSPRDPRDGALLLADPLAEMARAARPARLVEISTGELIPVTAPAGGPETPRPAWAPARFPRAMPAAEAARYPRRPRAVAEIPPFEPSNVRLWLDLLREGPRGARPRGRGAAAPGVEASPPEETRGGGARYLAGSDGSRLVRIGGRLYRVRTNDAPPEQREMQLELTRTPGMDIATIPGRGAIVAETIYRIAPPIDIRSALRLAETRGWSQTFRPTMDEAEWKRRKEGASFYVTIGYAFVRELEEALATIDPATGRRYGVVDPVIKAEFELTSTMREVTDGPGWEELLRGHSPLAKMAYALSVLELGLRQFPGVAGKPADGALLLNGAGSGDKWIVLTPDFRLFIVDRREQRLEAFRRGVLGAAGGVTMAYGMVAVAASFALPGSSMGAGALALMTAPRQALVRWLASPMVAARGMGVNLMADMGVSALTGQVRSMSDIKSMLTDPVALAGLVLDSIGDMHRKGFDIVVPPDVLGRRAAGAAGGAAARGAVPDLHAPAPEPNVLGPGAATRGLTPPSAGSSPSAGARGTEPDTTARPPAPDTRGTAPPSDPPRTPPPSDPPRTPPPGGGGRPPDEPPDPRMTGPESRGTETGAIHLVDESRIGEHRGTVPGDGPMSIGVSRLGVHPEPLPPRPSWWRLRRNLVRRGRLVTPRMGGYTFEAGRAGGEGTQFRGPIDAPEWRVIGGVWVVSRHPTVLLGSNPKHYRLDVLRLIAAHPNHPLRALLNEEELASGRLRYAPVPYPRRSGSLQLWRQNPQDIQIGHVRSNRTGEAEVLVVQTRYRNQVQGHDLERHGDVGMDEVFVIGGIPVHKMSAWDMFNRGMLRGVKTVDDLLALPTMRF